jgi:signal transduction histidine kinase
MTSPDVPAEQRPAGHAAVAQRATRPKRPKKRSFALRNWPVRRRLVVVIVLAAVMGLVFGGLRVTSEIATADSFARTSQLAALGQQVTALAQAMETERDVTAGVAAFNNVAAAAAAAQAPKAVLAGMAKDEAPEKTAQTAAQAATDTAAARTRSLAVQIGSQFPATTQQKAETVVSQIDLIPGLRSQLGGQPPSEAIQTYSEAIATFFNLNDEITSSSGDPSLADEVRTLGAISRAKDQASQQCGILYSALIEARYNAPNALNDAGGTQALTNAAGLEQADLVTFQTSATQAQQDAFLSTVAGSEVDTAQLLGNFINQAQNLQDVHLLNPEGTATFTAAAAPDVWYHSMTDLTNRMRTIELQVGGAIVARSQMLESGARQSAVLAAAVTGGVLLLVLIATFVVARSLVEPLRRLQAGALEIASVRLPSRVAELGQSADPEASLHVEPIGVDSTDEIGRVARAFDQVHQEAVRLAGNEAMLRGNVSAMFISLSRRSVPLIDRLTRMIDSLEQNEDDPDRLSNLFAMDHLVTRMRRNSENLLVLAGEEPVRKWSEPVPLADVTRAATSEIEQYGRVLLNVQPGIVVSGQAAADVVHLLAEILENATIFSPRDTSVYVSGQEVSTGGVLLEVRDSGIGISPTRLDEINWRLDNPPLVDVSVSRHMGLFAVSRLAARHGVRVRLRAATPQGLSALVWLPGTISGRESARYIEWRSQQLERESFTTLLRSGGRRLAARAGLVSHPTVAGQLDPADDQQDDALEPAAAGTSVWFRAKRPSGRGPTGAGDGTAAQNTTPVVTTAAAGQSGRAGGWNLLRSPGRDASNTRGKTSPGGQGGDWADRGWRVAETLSQPVLGDSTAAGLPTRVPGANLFPGSGGGTDGTAAGQRGPGRHSGDPGQNGPLSGGRAQLPRRSADLARNRLSGFQAGSREADIRTSSAGEGASR